MQPDSSHCPDPEVLAAFVAGNLSGAELEMIVEHLRECEDCRLEVSDGARYDRSQHEVQPQRRPQWPAWLLAAAAALAGIGYLSYILIRSNRPEAQLHALVEATPRDGRYLETRLTGGFPWAPLRPVQRDPGAEPDPQQMKLVGVAGDVIEETAGDPSPEAQHAAALAMLVSGSYERAAETLAKLAESSRDARIWSDLAAAKYTTAVHAGNPPQLAQALAAADKALELDNSLAEAAFNRALILEHLGLREPARAAWQRYLQLDPKSEWAAEAQKHLRTLGPAAEFGQELERRYAILMRHPAAAAELAKRFPQEARVWGESEILDRWARSELAGDAGAASGHLRVAEAFGSELVRRGGDGMLRQAVAAIERANGPARSALAEAHRDLREGQKTYRAGRPADAERLFRDSALKFASGHSPMALVSRYFAANTTFEQGRVDDAATELEQLLTESPAAFPAIAAQIQWQLGLVYGSRGRWGRALGVLGSSVAGFESLGEANYAMAVREILSEVHERIGEPRKAWDHRIIALQELGRFNTRRLHASLHAIARGAALQGDWPVSLSFINVQMALGRHPGDELTHLHSLLLRASVERQMGEHARAASDLAAASTAMSGMSDSAIRERAEAEQLAVQGLLAQSPERAIGDLSRAIDFQREKGRRMLLPELLLHRGRAFAATGNVVRAAEDFETGIHELEQQRTSIDAGDQRWGVFGAVDELFDEAVVLALRRSDIPTAFSYSERARARELLDSMGVNSVPSSVPAIDNAVILEYVQLPAKLVIFVIDRQQVRAVEKDVASSMITREVELLTRSAIAGDHKEFNRVAAVLYERLLRPVDQDLQDDDTLFIVPDGTLALVPFAALRDASGKHVIERRAVIVAPSVAVLARLRTAPRPLGNTPRLLMLSGPASRDADLRLLTAGKTEVDAVAAEYGGNVDYAADANAPVVLGRRSRANVVHFVGHAIGPAANTGAALVTSRRAGIDEQLDVREIAAMQLRDIRVVVLAACATARGYGRAGESSISVARAFLAAGVPSVVATLWTIDDGPAAEFFPRLHHHLVRGLPPAEALRATQLEWLRRRDVSPGTWAAVQIIGS